MESITDYYQANFEAFEQATRRGEPVPDRFYAIAGFTIQLRFAGPALIRLILPALEHLAVEAVPTPDLTIDLWDSTSTSIGAPPPPWNAGRHFAHGEVKEFCTDRFYTHLDVGPNALSLLDFDRKRAIFWVPDQSAIPDYEVSVPLRTILHIWLSRFGRHIVHAGAVGLPTGGVLLIGHGGAGKSNTALSCLGSELKYLSDDHCLVAAEPEPTVYSVYGTGKLFPEDIAQIPVLASLGDDAPILQTEKALFYLHRHFSHKILTEFPLKALLLLQVTGKVDSRLEPVSGAVGLRALAPGQMMQWPTAGPATFQTIARLCRQLPCYRFELGTDRAQIPRTILELLT
ncbi:MAG: serine kinase [Acidobacteria bacterium]|nr:serine kinase [Acidobacteriota bacterium]